MSRPLSSRDRGLSIGRLWRSVQRDLFTFRMLRTKFLALVIPAVLLCTIVVFGLFELNARYQANLQLQRKLDRLVVSQSAVLAESLWVLADRQIELILEALAIDQNVKGAVVYDHGGLPVATIGETAGMEREPFYGKSAITYVYDGEPRIIGRLAITLTNA